ncbi:hypothetical protein ACVWY2_008844 [Bradyrhizobium sp. JR6.1]
MIHVVNMRYAGTVEDDVYSVLSERFSDIFAALGQLPDSFEDAWVDAVLKDREAVRFLPQRVLFPKRTRSYSSTKTGFDLGPWFGMVSGLSAAAGPAAAGSFPRILRNPDG